MIRYSVLGSGSRGNTTYVEVDGAGILIDCGLSYVQIAKRLAVIGRDISYVSAIIISHSHGDHVKSLRKTLKYSDAVVVAPQDVDLAMFNPEHGRELSCFGEFVPYTITPFKLSHDVPCFGYAISDSDKNSLVYVTDTGCIPEESAPYIMSASALIFEFNHDVDLLVESPYAPETMERVFSDIGHMRNEESGAVLNALCGDSNRLNHLVLFHMSQNTNSINLAMYEAKTALEKSSCHVFNVAYQDKIMEPHNVLTLL